MKQRILQPCSLTHSIKKGMFSVVSKMTTHLTAAGWEYLVYLWSLFLITLQYKLNKTLGLFFWMSYKVDIRIEN